MCGCVPCEASRNEAGAAHRRDALLALIAAENKYLFANGWTYDESRGAGALRWSKAPRWKKIERTHAVNAQKQLDAADMRRLARERRD